MSRHPRDLTLGQAKDAKENPRTCLNGFSNDGYERPFACGAQVTVQACSPAGTFYLHCPFHGVVIWKDTRYFP